jgi:hypothetical protein
MADVSARAGSGGARPDEMAARLQSDLTELEEVVRRVRELMAITSDQQTELRPSDQAILTEIVEDSFMRRFVTLSALICEAMRVFDAAMYLAPTSGL